MRHMYSLSVFHTTLAHTVDARVLQMVGLGVCGVFELIRETRYTHPALCVRALQALLDMLQGQNPEALKLEPADAIGQHSLTFA